MDNRLSTTILLSSSVLFKVCAAVASFMLTASISRAFNIEEAGIFFSLLSSVIIISAVTIAGRDIYVMRSTTRLFIAKEFHALRLFYKKVATEVFYSTLAVVLLLLVAFLVTPFGLSKKYGLEFFAFVLTLPFFVMTIINGEFLRGVGRLQSLVLLHGLLLPVLAALLISLYSIFYSVGLVQAFAIYTGTTCFVWFLSEVLCHNAKKGLTVQAERQPGCSGDSAIEKDSGYLWLSVLAIANVFLQYAPVVILDYSNDSASASAFFVAFRLASLLSFCLLGVNVVVAPLMAKAFRLSDFGRLKRLLLISSAVGCLTSFPFFIAFVFYGEFFLRLFGDSYVAAKTTLLILSFGQLINASCGSVLNLLIMTGREQVVASIVVSAVVIVGSIIALLPITITNLSILLALANVFINLTAFVACWAFVFPSFRS